ncbi:MAG: signal recognition particle-docking protein FtsY [Candidatus Helarchaeota archaeon]|nr:signal recognition particle-docking protein FtsY [Candidatus Helarchaeota archaeon]
MFEKLKNAFGGLKDKITLKMLSEKNLNKPLQTLRTLLIQNDVSVLAAEKICDLLEGELSGEKVGRFGSTKKLLHAVLKKVITDILTSNVQIDILSLINQKKQDNEPAIFVFVGVNGIGKTTTIAKMAHYLRKNGFSCVLAASDTFRAGAIQQLDKHAKALKLKIIKGEYGTDGASIAFDAIDHAQARNINVVLIDTAGRMETNKNLMEEIKKIVRVTEPDLKIFVGSLLVGNAAWQQAETFSQKVGIDANILTMADADIKGGAALSITYLTKRPIIFLGNGQSYDDLSPFDPGEFANLLLGE